MDQSNITFVVENDLCTCCGTCAGLCPESAISIQETSGGLLLPVIDEDKCTKCGVCVGVCPGWKVEQIWPDDADAFEGQFVQARLVYAADPEFRLECQSAGAVTALLGFLLEQG